MLSFIRISRQLPPLNSKIIGCGHLENYGKRIDYFIAEENANGGKTFKIAINPLLHTGDLESLVGTTIESLLKQSSKDANESPYLIINPIFSPIEGKVISARTINFGHILLSELIIEKVGEDSPYHVAFFCHRRRRRQGLTLAKKTVRVSPDSLVIKDGKRNIKWNGTNL